MFKKLYRNLLTLNIVIISLLLLAVFTSLYFTTYREVNLRIDAELSRLISYSTDDVAPPTGGEFNDQFRPERTRSFVVILDASGAIDEVFTQLPINNNTVLEIVDAATKSEGYVSFDDQKWDYLKHETALTTTIAFVNTTDDRDLLNDTLVSFIVIFVVSIAVTTIISSLLTKKSIKPVQDSFNKQEQFVSDASHELKTPLTVINTNVDILISEDQTNNKWLKYIKSEVTRMSKLTQDLLYLSKVTEFDKNEVQTSMINLSEKLESITLGVEALMYEKQINLNYDIKPDINVLFHSDQLHQVIMILIDNAIKYTNKNGSIDIVLEEQNSSILLKIKNTGKGIPEQDLKHIFDRFYKVDKSRELESNSFGLGLSIAKTVCDNNNAKLSVKSEENNFTEFTIKMKTN